MKVDEAGGQDEPLGVDGLLGAALPFADGDDRIAPHGDVADEPILAGSVVDRRAPEDEVGIGILREQQNREEAENSHAYNT